MQSLKQIRLKNYKSIADQTIDLKPLNVIIGANGAGKSNLISVFKMMNAMFAREPGFRNYVGQAGGGGFSTAFRQAEVAHCGNATDL